MHGRLVLTDALRATIVASAAGEGTTADAERACARATLLEALARGLRALRAGECRAWLGPLLPGATMMGGARVPGTSYELDPVQAAFNLGLLFYIANEQLAPASCPHDAGDCLGGLLAVADYQSRQNRATDRPALRLRHLLDALGRARSIQCALARPGTDLPPQQERARSASIATAAVATALLGGSRAQLAAAVATSCVDGGAQGRVALADATAHGVRCALRAMMTSDDALGTPAVASPPAAVVCVRSQPDFRQLLDALNAAVVAHYPAKQAAMIASLFTDVAALDALPVDAFIAALVRN
ncbi:MAG: MmgE/PrpD family protein [Proteobacteria bacterium]|nr:MmgE/PrpD family protein [Pseudomonadota bacterium]